jgi:hypothetical protein
MVVHSIPSSLVARLPSAIGRCLMVAIWSRDTPRGDDVDDAIAAGHPLPGPARTPVAVTGRGR